MKARITMTGEMLCRVSSPSSPSPFTPPLPATSLHLPDVGVCVCMFVCVVVVCVVVTLLSVCYCECDHTVTVWYFLVFFITVGLYCIFAFLVMGSDWEKQHIQEHIIIIIIIQDVNLGVNVAPHNVNLGVNAAHRECELGCECGPIECELGCECGPIENVNLGVNVVP